jgi:hypothetical protein
VAQYTGYREGKALGSDEANRLRIDCFAVIGHRKGADQGLFTALHVNVYIKTGRVAWG